MEKRVEIFLFSILMRKIDSAECDAKANIGSWRFSGMILKVALSSSTEVFSVTFTDWEGTLYYAV